MFVNIVRLSSVFYIIEGERIYVCRTKNVEDI